MARIAHSGQPSDVFKTKVFLNNAGFNHWREGLSPQTPVSLTTI
jgi:hypothetical protein